MSSPESRVGSEHLVKTTYRHEGKLAVITLNRPRYANALNADLVEGLLAAVQGCIEQSVELLVLQGAGAVFCGGFDLRGLERENDASLAYRFLRLETLLQAIHYAPCQTLVFAQGSVSGAGADLMAACRKRIAAPDAVFRFPGIRFGILLGTNRLRALIGEQAQRVLLEQTAIPAEQAQALGLIHEMSDESGFEAMVEREYFAIGRIPVATRHALLTEASPQAAIDMGMLAKTIAIPGLHARIQKYWDQIQAARAQRRTDAATAPVR